MFDSMDIYKSLNINIGTVMRKPEMLKFVPDYLKTKKIRKLLIYIRLNKCVKSYFRKW